MATAQRLSYRCPPEEQEILVSYLPLSYMGAQLFDMWVSISVAGALYFAQPDALRVSGAPPPSSVVGAGEAGEAGGVGVTLRGVLDPELESPPCPRPQPAVQLWSFSSLGLSFPIWK